MSQATLGFSQGNPHLYPWKPAPVTVGAGFDSHGLWVAYNPRVSKPVGDQNAFSYLKIYCTVKKRLSNVKIGRAHV